MRRLSKADKARRARSILGPNRRARRQLRRSESRPAIAGDVRRAARARAEKTKNDQRYFDQAVAEQQYVQNAARFIAKKLDEIGKRGMIFLQSAQLMRPERKKRRLQSRKKRGHKNQSGDCGENNCQRNRRHSWLRSRTLS